MRVIFDKVKNVKEIELKKEPKEILELKITITEKIHQRGSVVDLKQQMKKPANLR